MMSTFHVCDVCGKTYLRPGESIYKIRYRHKDYLCCSYTCYRKVQKAKEGEITWEVFINEIKNK